ncbi:MAG: hypothetical protein ACRDTA_11640 [Pseudonocardiaceae bacterium]
MTTAAARTHRSAVENLALDLSGGGFGGREMSDLISRVRDVTVRQLVPEGLAQLAPGPELDVLLGGLDIAVLTGTDLVEVLRARARQLSHEQAQLLAAMVEVGLCDPLAGLPDADRFTTGELAARIKKLRESVPCAPTSKTSADGDAGPAGPAADVPAAPNNGESGDGTGQPARLDLLRPALAHHHRPARSAASPRAVP